jgi:hypothetical protein
MKTPDEGARYEHWIGAANGGISLSYRFVIGRRRFYVSLLARRTMSVMLNWRSYNGHHPDDQR